MKIKPLQLIAILAFSVLSVQAQGYFPFACSNGNSLAEKDYKKWTESYLSYIITETEKTAFLSLQTTEDRNAFIENFWLRRDPDPDTEENEFRVEYCERLIETIQFTAGMPGWRTDRGIIYLFFGKPDRIERGRADFKEYDNVLFEKWFYKHLDGFCSGVDFTFYDPTEIDQFSLRKRNREELLKLYGSGLTVSIGGCKNESF